MRRLPFRLLTIVTLLASAFAGPAQAAGSGGGGMGSGTYSEARRAMSSPEQQSAKAFRAGVKQRDKALRQEQKAAKASSDRKRDRALAKAEKYYRKAIEQQGEALRLNPRNYEAANELGFALRKTGDYRKAIGAYNYALEINPNFHPATEYRGEAFLALGMFDHAKQAYMLLFREDRELAAQLMTRFDDWREETSGEPSETRAAFLSWVDERKRMARITADLSLNNTRSW